MTSDDPFEGILAKLTTEEGKKELIRDELERREGVEVVSMERTSTGWRVIAERKPGAGGDEGRRPSGSVSIYVPTLREQIYWYCPHYRWVIPIEKLGPTPSIRETGLGLIKDVATGTIAAIERSLGRINDNQQLAYYDPKSECEGFCHPDLIYSLGEFWKDFRRRYGVINMLPIVSGYRRVGMHVPRQGGRPGDPSGGGDYVDGARGTERAHWQGLSVDVGWRFWADRKSGIIARYFRNDDDAFERYINGYNLQRTLRHIEYERNHVSLM